MPHLPFLYGRESARVEWLDRNNDRITNLLVELEEWPGSVMKRHNDAKLLYHKLVFLSDLGFTIQEPVIAKLAEKILSSASADGPFRIWGNVPSVFGGSGKDEYTWMLCDAPLVSYALIRLGLGKDERVVRSVHSLMNLMKDFGWPCAADSRFGTGFKGPGKRSDPCPYANLIMLRLLSVIPEQLGSEQSRRAAEVLLHLWEYRKSKKYYLFGMGTDFKKLKLPLIWYDILHLTAVLSCFPFLKNDPRLGEMMQLLEHKQDTGGSYRAESVYRNWKEWDFGQKKLPSQGITWTVQGILERWRHMNLP